MTNPGEDQIAVVINDHTGKVEAQFCSCAAEDDAYAHQRTCKGKVDHMSSTSVITGEDAKKAIENGRV